MKPFKYFSHCQSHSLNFGKFLIISGLDKEQYDNANQVI